MNLSNNFYFYNLAFKRFDFKLFMMYLNLTMNILGFPLHLNKYHFFYYKILFQGWKARTNHYIWHKLELSFRKSISLEIVQTNCKCFEACSDLKIYWFYFQLFGNIIAKLLRIHMIQEWLCLILFHFAFYSLFLE